MASPSRAELVKATTTRSAAWLVAGATVTVALVTAGSVLSLPVRMLDGDYHAQQFILVGAIVLTLFSAVAGVRMFTDEYRHGVIVASAIAVPDRRRLFTAKAVTAVVIAAVISLVGQAAMAGVALLLAGQKGATLSLAATDFRAAAGLLVACLLWALIGTGVGAIARQPVAAVVGTVVWIVVVENAAGGFLHGAARLLPGQAGHAVALVFRVEGLLSPLAGGALLAGYALAALLLGLVLFDRRDVAPV